MQNDFQDVLEIIEEALLEPGRRPITSVKDLVDLIVGRCIGAIDNVKLCDETNLLQIFDLEISNVVCKIHHLLR